MRIENIEIALFWIENGKFSETGRAFGLSGEATSMRMKALFSLATYRAIDRGVKTLHSAEDLQHLRVNHKDYCIEIISALL